ncbi:hypothetical protein RYX36_001230 [Vicia faba]
MWLRYSKLFSVELRFRATSNQKVVSGGAFSEWDSSNETSFVRSLNMAVVTTRRKEQHGLENNIALGSLNKLIEGCGTSITPAHEKIGVVDEQWIVHQTIPTLGERGEYDHGKDKYDAVCLFDTKTIVLSQFSAFIALLYKIVFLMYCM